MLYLVATPIGNLADITYRAIETLRACDYILCEDTRHSKTLLDHYDVQKPLKSYHQFNEAQRESSIIEDLKSGLTIAVLSDAGTPGICDPGQKLILCCQKEGVPYTVLPGACAFVSAVTLSGLATPPFQFIGFLPKKPGELKKALQEALLYKGATLSYESPHRILTTLEEIASLAPSRRLAVARELTKKFEEVIQGTAEELLKRAAEHPFRGEIVLLIEKDDNSLDFSDLSPEEHVRALEETYGLSRMDAIKMAASLRKESKRDLYKQLNNNNLE